MRHMISTVEIVIDIHLPVALQLIFFARMKVKGREPERLHALHKITKKLPKRLSIRSQIHKDKVLPSLNSNWHKPVLFAPEITNPGKLRHPLEAAIQPIIPSVIRAAKRLRLSTGSSHDSRSMMPAYVIK